MCSHEGQGKACCLRKQQQTHKSNQANPSSSSSSRIRKGKREWLSSSIPSIPCFCFLVLFPLSLTFGFPFQAHSPQIIHSFKSSHQSHRVVVSCIFHLQSWIQSHQPLLILILFSSSSTSSLSSHSLEHVLFFTKIEWQSSSLKSAAAAASASSKQQQLPSTFTNQQTYNSKSNQQR